MHVNIYIYNKATIINNDYKLHQNIIKEKKTKNRRKKIKLN